MAATVNFSSITATTSPFTLTPGTYGLVVSSTSFGSGVSATLEIESLDGTTFIAVIGAFTLNGYAVIDLPEGTYKVVVGGSPSALFFSIAGIR